MLAQRSSHLLGHRVLHAPRSPFRPVRMTPVRSFGDPRPSVDPLANKPRAPSASPGSVYTVLSPEEVEAVLTEHKDRLVIVMCKASHCKPCKRFMTKYNRMAELLPDSVLLDITGDHSVDTKKVMLQWGVKSTPTFRMFRGGECVGTITGAKEAKVLPLVTGLLKDGERGKNLLPEDLEDDTTDDES